MKEITVYETEGGVRFDKEWEALEHEAALELSDKFTHIISHQEAMQISRVLLNGVESYVAELTTAGNIIKDAIK